MHMATFEDILLPFGNVPDEAEFLARCEQYRPTADARELYARMCEHFANAEDWAGSEDAVTEQRKVEKILASIGVEWRYPSML